MLLKKDLCKGMDERYVPMLEKVSICDFTKCIAQFSGLPIQDIPDNVICNYLQTWAQNKYLFYLMLGEQLRVDTKIEYSNNENNYKNEFDNLSRSFPAYIPWLEGFKQQKKNKIENPYDISYEVKRYIGLFFPSYHLEGSSLTHFFKSCLQAPDELVTAIGRIFENQTISAFHTISIDPVDMMLASENPYNWTSCYRLANENECSHADGCLAAVLDSSSLITYVWNHEGKFSLYNNYDFKNIRYKRMREWISISPTMNCIHFNEIYPGKNYSESFNKKMRDIVETRVATYRGLQNFWEKDFECRCERWYDYGYGEYSEDKIWRVKEGFSERWNVYDERIECPCGCGQILPESDGCGYEYNGDGFILENFIEDYYDEEEYYDEEDYNALEGETETVFLSPEASFPVEEITSEDAHIEWPSIEEI